MFVTRENVIKTLYPPQNILIMYTYTHWNLPVHASVYKCGGGGGVQQYIDRRELEEKRENFDLESSYHNGEG